MNLNSNDYLQLLAGEGAHIVRSRADAYVLKSANGRDLELELGGFAYSPVELPTTLFDDLRVASLIHQDGRDRDGNTVYRLTRDGMLKGLAEAA